MALCREWHASQGMPCWQGLITCTSREGRDCGSGFKVFGAAGSFCVERLSHSIIADTGQHN